MTTLSSSSATSTTGKRNATPKMKSIKRKSVRYWLGLYSVSSVVPPIALKPADGVGEAEVREHHARGEEDERRRPRREWRSDAPGPSARA